MSELQAALGLAVLERLDEEIARRRRLLACYRERLAIVPGIGWLRAPDTIGTNCQYCVIRVHEDEFGCTRDVLHRELRGYNVFTRKYFSPLCSDYPCYHALPSASAANLPIATQAAREVLCLPLYGGLAESDVDRICEMVATIGAARGNVAASAAE
jgi:dTDP-4-amino-4,6-dideoxygalactose transaminase